MISGLPEKLKVVHTLCRGHGKAAKTQARWAASRAKGSDIGSQTLLYSRAKMFSKFGRPYMPARKKSGPSFRKLLLRAGLE